MTVLYTITSSFKVINFPKESIIVSESEQW